MSLDYIQVGQKGLSFRATIKDASGTVVDISTATTKQLIFRKSNASSNTTVTAEFVTDGTDGQMEYVTSATSFLSVGGIWRVQGYVVLSAGDEFKTNIHTFRVEDNL